MRIEEATALVSGANRGIGRATTEALLAAGAQKVYAAARKPDALDDLVNQHGDRVVPLTLDVTSDADVAAAADRAGDINLLINNAGVLYHTTGLGDDDLDHARTEIEVNYLGLLRMARAFAPILQHNGGGAMVNLASIASHVAFPILSTYSASKAAVHSITVSLRAHLAAKGTHVVGVYPGPIDTAMAEGIPFDKAAPSDVANTILRAVEQGEEDVFPDPTAQELYADARADPKQVERRAAEITA